MDISNLIMEIHDCTSNNIRLPGGIGFIQANGITTWQDKEGKIDTEVAEKLVAESFMRQLDLSGWSIETYQKLLELFTSKQFDHFIVMLHYAIVVPKTQG